jgi:DNA repair protein RecO (recombination protein O)
MAPKVSESIILRTYPYREADLIVSFFARDQGKLRGVARRAKRPKSGMAAGLERLTHGRVFYSQKENVELVRIDNCEIAASVFDLVSRGYEHAVVLDFLAEVSELLLPLQEPDERFFRLILAVLADLRHGGNPWRACVYFSLWAVRLQGFLPALLISAEGQALAREIVERPVALLEPRDWSKRTGADLRRFLVRAIEEHVERRLITAPLLESL